VTRGNSICSDAVDLFSDALEVSAALDCLGRLPVSSAAAEIPANEAAAAAFTKSRREVLFFNGIPLCSSVEM